MVAPRILWRYILRDALAHSLLGLAAFTLVLVVMNVLRFLEPLLSAGVGAWGLVQLVWVILPSYLPYAIPTSLLFGILLAFGRMSADGEIVAMRASGVSVPGLLPPVLLLGLVATAFTAYLQFEIEPQTNRRMKNLVRDAARSVTVIRPGEFRSLGANRVVFVESEADPPCPLRGIMIGDFTNARRPIYIAARCASVVPNASVDGLAFELTEGSIHFDDPAQDRYRRIRFERMRTEIDVSGLLQRLKKPRDYRFSELLDLDARFERGETPELRGSDGRIGVQIQIHRRMAFALASLLLSMLAVPLGIQPLRSGRSAGALTAIGLMALYWGLFSVGERAADGGMIAPWIAMWAPDALVFVIAVWMLRRTVYGES